MPACPELAGLKAEVGGSTRFHAASPTSRNLRATGKVRLGIGPTRDLVLIEGTVGEVVDAAEVPDEVGDAFAAKTGFDPRQLSGYRYFRIHPRRLQAWREANELEGRELMAGGRWRVPEAAT